MEEFSQSPSKTVLLATITSKSDYSEKYFGLNNRLHQDVFGNILLSVSVYLYGTPFQYFCILKLIV